MGLGGLGLSIVAALLLVLEHFNALSLPGCGPGSACARAAASVWGKLPLSGWPVSAIGLAYFAGLAAAWITARGAIEGLLLAVVRAGAVISVFYIVVMIAGGYACAYCLAVHVGNFVFWFASERAPHASVARRRQVGASATTFVAATLILAAGELYGRTAAMQRAERQLAESTAAVIAQTERLTRLAESPKSAAATGIGSAPERWDTAAASVSQSEGGTREAAFTGRYRLGPAVAPIRIVVFTDYQCPDCQRIETELRALTESRADVSLSTKHFPFCTQCNPHVPQNLHPNACWAARAAEAAGILAGDDGFWGMHRWLFDRKGSFTDAELRQGLADLGFDARAFEHVMQSEQTLQRVQEDIAEALTLGLHFTPMVFINGGELKGWDAPRAVTRTVERLAATNPPPLTAEHDHPPAAIEKYIADWREQPRAALPADARTALGPAEARVQVVIFGDYQEQNTAEADALARAELAAHGDVRYVFRHFPFDAACNPGVQSTRHPWACRAARTAEAAGLLGGSDEFWKVHVWLLANRQELNEQTLIAAAAAAVALDADALARQAESPEAAAAVRGDAELGRRLGVRGIPTVFVNGRRVPRWRLPGGQSVLERILAAARNEP